MNRLVRTTFRSSLQVSLLLGALSFVGSVSSCAGGKPHPESSKKPAASASSSVDVSRMEGWAPTAVRFTKRLGKCQATVEETVGGNLRLGATQQAELLDALQDQLAQCLGNEWSTPGTALLEVTVVAGVGAVSSDVAPGGAMPSSAARCLATHLRAMSWPRFEAKKSRVFAAMLVVSCEPVSK